MTQARLVGENEASIPGNGRLDQSFLNLQITTGMSSILLTLIIDVQKSPRELTIY